MKGDSVLLKKSEKRNLVEADAAPNFYGKKEDRSDVIKVESGNECHKFVSYPDNCLPAWFAKAHFFNRLYKESSRRCHENHFLNQPLSRRLKKIPLVEEKSFASFNFTSIE